MNNTKEYAKTLASMCIDFLQGGIDEETFKANLNMMNSILNPERSVATKD